MNTVGGRLREERLRLKLDQETLGRHGGVQKLAQGNYEKDRRSPDVEYLHGIAKAGVDVVYVVTGVRAPEANRMSPAKALRLVSDVLEGLGLSSLEMDKVKILINYSIEYHPSEAQLTQFVRSMYAFAGIDLPQEKQA